MSSNTKRYVLQFPDPVIKIAIEPKSKADLEKMSNGLIKLAQEDPSFHFSRDEETNQTVIEGMGELHLVCISTPPTSPRLHLPHLGVFVPLLVLMVSMSQDWQAECIRYSGMFTWVSCGGVEANFLGPIPVFTIGIHASVYQW